MDLTVHLSDKEVRFLQRMIDQEKQLSHREYSFEDAVHECIRDSMFDEGEVSAEEEFE